MTTSKCIEIAALALWEQEWHSHAKTRAAWWDQPASVHRVFREKAAAAIAALEAKGVTVARLEPISGALGKKLYRKLDDPA